MRLPTGKYEININTLILFMGLLLTGVGWGKTYSDMQAITRGNTSEIGRLESRVNQIDADNRKFESLGFRVGVLETGAATFADTQKDLIKTLTQLSSDMRVTRTIVERLDKKSENGSSYLRPPQSVPE